MCVLFLRLEIVDKLRLLEKLRNWESNENKSKKIIREIKIREGGELNI